MILCYTLNVIVFLSVYFLLFTFTFRLKSWLKEISFNALIVCGLFFLVVWVVSVAFSSLFWVYLLMKLSNNDGRRYTLQYYEVSVTQDNGVSGSSDLHWACSWNKRGKFLYVITKIQETKKSVIKIARERIVLWYYN